MEFKTKIFAPLFFNECDGKEVAVAVVVEDSGSGSYYATPIAEKIFDLYFK